MNPIASLLAELDHEAAVTRTFLERLPDGRFDFRPHVKSMTLGQLAGHLAMMYEWGTDTLLKDEVVFDPATFTPTILANRAEVVARFEKNLAAFRAALEQAPPASLAAPWRLKQVDTVLFEMPRGVVLRGMIFNHLVHHRAQLGVYLRLLDVPVPAAYGPSADEQG